MRRENFRGNLFLRIVAKKPRKTRKKPYLRPALSLLYLLAFFVATLSTELSTVKTDFVVLDHAVYWSGSGDGLLSGYNNSFGACRPMGPAPRKGLPWEQGSNLVCSSVFIVLKFSCEHVSGGIKFNKAKFR